MLGTVGKAGRVLDLFTAENPEWGVMEAAGALELPRSSAHELLATLVETGLLRRSESNRYQLGWKVLALSHTVLATSDVRTHAEPTMRVLADRLGAVVHVATLEDGEVMYIDKLVPRDGPSILSAVGIPLSPHCRAVGKALLAHQPPRVVADAIDRCQMRSYTDRTIASPDALRFELASIRDTGIARDREETMDGICCHAAPIFDRGRVVAALSICVDIAFDERFAERYSEVVRSAATRITRNLHQGDRDCAGRTAGAR